MSVPRALEQAGYSSNTLDVRKAVCVLVVGFVLAAAGASGAGARSSFTAPGCGGLAQRHSLSVAVAQCISPLSVKTSASLSWTTCKSKPATPDYYCLEGTSSVTFRSSAGSRGTGAFGGLVGAKWTLVPGSGTFRCSSSIVNSAPGGQVTRTSNGTFVRHVDALVVGLVPVRSMDRIMWWIGPSTRSGFVGGYFATPNACRYVLLDSTNGPTDRATWPGKAFAASALNRSSETLVIPRGSLTSSWSIPHPEDWGIAPGARIDQTATWQTTTIGLLST